MRPEGYGGVAQHSDVDESLQGDGGAEVSLEAGEEGEVIVYGQVFETGLLLLLLLLSGGIVVVVIVGDLLIGIVALGGGGCLLLRWLGHGCVVWVVMSNRVHQSHCS